MLLNILFSFFTLTVLEVILGIDNLVFISIVTSRLPIKKQKSARRLGLILALICRLILLALALELVHLTQPLLSIYTLTFSARDLFFLIGGLFLIAKGTKEIHTELESAQENKSSRKKYAKFFSVIIQIMIFDIVFSLDSILTAVGLTQIYWVMATAICIAVLLMIIASEPLSRFIQAHPTIKMLALSFLLLIGTALVADSFHFAIPRGYIYFSVCFSIFVETLNNLLARKKARHG